MDTSTQPCTIRATDVRNNIGEVLRRVGVNGEHLIVERNQFPIVAIIPIADYKALLEDKKRVEQSIKRV